jgi:hypothetical protein
MSLRRSRRPYCVSSLLADNIKPGHGQSWAFRCPTRPKHGLKEGNMLSTILIIILILILIGAFPSWPYSRGWGYGPSGVVGLILVILLILLLLGRI